MHLLLDLMFLLLDLFLNTQYGIGNSKIDSVLVRYIDGEILPVLPVEVKETGIASKNHKWIEESRKMSRNY